MYMEKHDFRSCFRRIVETPADGRCGFFSLAHYYLEKNPTGESLADVANQMRLHAANTICSGRKDLPVVPEDHGHRDLKSYCRDLHSNRYFQVDQTILSILAESLNARIWIFRPEAHYYSIVFVGDGPNDVYLRRTGDVNSSNAHYERLLPETSCNVSSLLTSSPPHRRVRARSLSAQGEPVSNRLVTVSRIDYCRATGDVRRCSPITKSLETLLRKAHATHPSNTIQELRQMILGQSNASFKHTRAPRPIKW